MNVANCYEHLKIFGRLAKKSALISPINVLMHNLSNINALVNYNPKISYMHLMLDDTFIIPLNAIL